MQQHPIPQNITGFEFKLIGDMTIKQFAYLAGGAVLAYLFFASPLHVILKAILIPFTVLLAIGLAFIPIEGRPLDRWISNFIRALFSPSQYLFHKEATIPDYLKHISSTPQVLPKKAIAPTTPAQDPLLANRKKSQERLMQLLQATPLPTLAPDPKEQDKLAAINEAFTQAPPPKPANEKTPLVIPIDMSKLPKATHPVPTIAHVVREPIKPEPTPAKAPTPVTTTPIVPPTTPVLSGFSIPFQNPTPTPTPLPRQELSTPTHMDPVLEKKLEEQRRLADENQKLKQELEELKKKLMAPIPVNPTPAQQPEHIMQEALAIEQKLHQALTDKERLASELSSVKTALVAKEQPKASPVTPTASITPQQERVKIIPPTMATQTGMIGLSSLPNVISGIIKDAKGDIIPNIIVEVKDATGSPVRAFKTNKLGQFYGATPLANGKYTIELEDPRNQYTFDIIAIELTGQNFHPIEIMPKTAPQEKTESEREQLYHALFGGQQQGIANSV